MAAETDKSTGLDKLTGLEQNVAPPVEILLIEDNPGDARLIREMLHDTPDCDWRIIHVDRLDSGMELLSSKSFDLCLLDLNLPDSGGGETVEQLSRFFKLPILVLTGLDDAEVGIDALRRGAQDYLVKGQVEGPDLSRAIRYALERFRIEQRFRQVFRYSSDAILVIDLDANAVLEANPRAAVVLGLAHEALLKTSVTELVAEHAKSWQRFVEEVQKRGSRESESLTFTHPSGKAIHAEVSGSVVQEGDSCLLIAVLRDMTERRRLLKELEVASHYDTLTSLPNRRYLEEQYKKRSRRSRSDGQVSLISVDLSGFKRINDSLGFEAGDELLVQVAERLKRVARDNDVVARSGGDEFTIMLQSQRSYTAPQVADRVKTALTSLFTVSGQSVSGQSLSGQSLRLRVSIGVADDKGAEDFTELVRRADQAMHEAKTQGASVQGAGVQGAGQESDIVFYSEEANARLRNWLWLERNLRDALDRNLDRNKVGEGGLELYFQPLPTLKQTDTDLHAADPHAADPHAEALLRWFHPEKGLISPGEFVPLAEEAGLITQLDCWVLENALEQARSGGFTVAVNVSPQTLQAVGFVDFVKAQLEATRLRSERLAIEVTEGVLAQPEQVLPILQELSDLGIKIMIDDFGTGYSSLSYLLSYPLHGLKVDRAFIKGLGVQPKAELVAQMVVKLAKDLGIAVVAEGIETEAQLAWATEVGCDRAQGYLIGKPMPYQDFLNWCQERETHVLA